MYNISKSFFIYTLMTLVLTACVSAGDNTQHSGPHDGMTRAAESGGFEAYDLRTSQWVNPDDFWQSFANNHIGKYWGASSEYPNYDDVNEFDTILIKLDKGSCLMEFFHSRWRRAQDVRRWDEKFNEYSGCPYVFE